MGLLAFVLLIVNCFFGFGTLLFVLTKHDSIKQFEFRMTLKRGIEVKSLFYKK